MRKTFPRLSSPQSLVLNALAQGKALAKIGNSLSELYSVDGKNSLCREKTVFALLRLRYIRVRRGCEFVITEDGLDAIRRAEKIAIV